MLEEYQIEELLEPLEKWFLTNKRQLPWRSNPTPYHVWVSEIMLQQTRVEAVKPYYKRFMEELPDIVSLANCKEERLLKLWEGLGYYNRVRNLQKGAIQVMEEYQGELPASYEELLKIKGIGPYTAGAIASMAFGQLVPAVDGNVLRIFMRVSGDDSDIAKPQVKKRLETRLKEAFLNEKIQINPRIINQAMMELGAIVCLPNGMPHCMECPWQEMCIARNENRIFDLPVKAKKKERRVEEKTVLVLRDGKKVALHIRPKKGLLSGLYEFPNFEGYQSEDEIVNILDEMGYEPLRILPLLDAKHIFSHVEWHMKGYEVFVSDLDLLTNKKEHNWIFAEIDTIEKEYAIPSAFERYTSYLGMKRF